MLFNSLQFIIFFIVITLAYYSLPQRGRVWLLLLASCYFYMVFKPVYILIIFVTIIVDYFAGIWLEKTEGKQRKYLLILSLISNISFLAFFKYYNFINGNIGFFLEKLHLHNTIPYLDFILPIGLSFHTFQAMSYTIEVYRGNQKAEKDFVTYALYVMFYPQLVAGPIERPQNVMGQFHTYFHYDFENIKAGLLRMSWGFFKKVVIADRLRIMVDACYDKPAEHNGITLLVATIFFTFEIYCDFSGYSDIALGAAKVMGFRLMENFERPYFSKSISEFWRRWHISLSSWFRDYLYIPLGGNRVSEGRWYFNQFFVFMVSGLWHGANWHYVIWGALHGIYLILAVVRDKYIMPHPKSLSRGAGLETTTPLSSEGKLKTTPLSTGEGLGVRLFNTTITFILVMLTWVFFRATSIGNSILILKKIFTFHFSDLIATPLSKNEMLFCWILLLFLMVKDYFFNQISTKNTYKFYLFFVVFIALDYFFGIFSSSQFIYFQF